RATVEIDGHVVAFMAKQEPEQNVAPQPSESSRSRCDDHLGELSIALDNRRSRGLDHVTDLRIRKSIAKGTDSGCRENDVANLPQTNQQDLQSVTARWLLRRSTSPGCRL